MELSNIRIASQIRSLVDHICQQEVLKGLSSKKINADVETEVSEVVKIYLRQVARASQRRLLSYQLIEQAFQKATNAFTKRLQTISSNDASENIEKIQIYLRRIKLSLSEKNRTTKQSLLSSLDEMASELIVQRRSLPGVSGNMSEQIIRAPDVEYENLFHELLEHLERKVKASENQSREALRLEFFKVGFDDFIEGLVINPLIDDLDEYFLSLEDLPEEFQLQRTEEYNNFPFEITANRFVFILDEDGTLFVFVENLPPDSVREAGQLLIKLGVHLYRP